MPHMTMAAERSQRYTVNLTWEGNRGEGTRRYDGYGREYRVRIAGKPDLLGSADAAFRGLAERHNPEDLFLAALSSCHMLAYLALCARRQIAVLAYIDDARGVLTLEPSGGGRFTEVILAPQVVISDAARTAEAAALHQQAHAECFIAASCKVPVRCAANVAVEEAHAPR